jgi:hypothetical protein
MIELPALQLIRACMAQSTVRVIDQLDGTFMLSSGVRSTKD